MLRWVALDPSSVADWGQGSPFSHNDAASMPVGKHVPESSFQTGAPPPTVLIRRCCSHGSVGGKLFPSRRRPVCTTWRLYSFHVPPGVFITVSVLIKTISDWGRDVREEPICIAGPQGRAQAGLQEAGQAARGAWATQPCFPIPPVGTRGRGQVPRDM